MVSDTHHPAVVPAVVAVVSDLHCNHPAGLLAPSGVTLHDGNIIHPNRVQEWLWERWLAYWQWVGEALNRLGTATPLFIVVNGELVDGFHHGSTEFLTASSTTMRAIAREVLSPALSLHPHPTLLVLRGTEAHSGKQGEDDEELAVQLGAVPDPSTGAHSFYHLRMEVGDVRLDIKHHGRGASLPWTAGGNANRLAAQLTYDYYGDEVSARPHLAIRSHVHRYADSANLHPIRAVFTDPWQVQSVYGHKVDGGSGRRVVGGVVVECGVRGDLVDGEHLPYRLTRLAWASAREPMLRFGGGEVVT